MPEVFPNPFPRHFSTPPEGGVAPNGNFRFGKLIFKQLSAAMDSRLCERIKKGEGPSDRV